MIKKIIFLFFLFFLSLQFVSSATNISACGTVSVSGTYELNQSITSTNTCLTINSSDVFIDCNGNTIFYNTGGTLNGQIGINAILGTVFLRNITIQNCNIIDTNAANSTGYGILFTRVTNSYIYNNFIQTNGTLTNHGVYLTTGSENNTIENNTINAFGSSTGNFGVYLYHQSNNNLIRGNNITGTGTTTSYALYLVSSKSNIITNNRLLTYSTNVTGTTGGNTLYLYYGSENNTVTNNFIYGENKGTNYVVYLSYNSNINSIINNTVISNGTEGANLGFYVLGSDLNQIKNNTIFTYGTTGSYGIQLGASSYKNIVQENFIQTDGTTTNNYGIYLLNALENIIFRNQILAHGGSTGNAGITLTNARGNYIAENNISTNGTTGGYGIYLSGSDYDNLFNNTISTYGLATSTTTSNYGIYLTTSTNNNVTSNNVLANGTSSSVSAVTTGNFGVYLNAAGYNYVNNNIISTDGKGVSHGVYLLTSNNNTVVNNAISTSGSYINNHGIYISTSANKNKIFYNNVSTFGTTTNHGISITTYSDDNYILGNNIVANGSIITAGTTTSNYGITLTTSCYNNFIENNTMDTGGGRYNYGLSVFLNCNNNTFKGNFVNSGGAGASNAGIYNSEGKDNVFEDNILSTSGTSANYGVYFFSNAQDNLIKGNNISTLGSIDSHAFYFNGTSPNFPHNNNIQNNNMVSINGNDLHIAAGGIDNLTLIDQNISTYYFTGLGSLVTIRNSSAGEIKFLLPINGTTQTNFSERVKILENYAFVEGEVSGLNKSAQVTLFNLPTTSTELQIYRNGDICPPIICENLTSMQAGNVTFNVTGWTSYSILATSSLPFIELDLPQQYFVSNQQSFNFNFTTSDDSIGDLNCSVYLDNILNQTNSSVINNSLTNFLIEGIYEGNHSWYVECFDSAGNLNISEVRNLSIAISQPLTTLNYPTNNLYLDNTRNVSLNYTVSDADLREMTVWLYGDDSLISVSTNVLNGSTLVYNWNGLSLGRHNWSVKVGNGIKNSTQEYSYFNIINLTINCEVGGPYQQNALVLVTGGVSDGNSSLSSQEINASLYLNGNYIANKLTNSFGGIFQTNFSSLSTGAYLLNATTTYHGISNFCTDSFFIGGSALLSLDKLVSLQEINSTSAVYNITLRVVNYGASTSTSVNLSDNGYNFSIDSLGFGEVETRSYLLNFTRSSELSLFLTPSAIVSAIDSYSGNKITANSLAINLTIPSTETGQQLTLIKNIYYANQTFNDVNYTETLQIVNSGGVDLEGIVITDDDLNISEVTTLNRTQSKSYSGYKVISKEQNNKEQTFSIARAVINLLVYSSNQIKILIPGYGGGPNDVSIGAPTSVSGGATFETTMIVKNVNEDIGQDFILSYWLLSNDESTTYSSGVQTLFVAGNGSTNSTIIHMLAPVNAGTYKIRANVSGLGVGVQATALSTFVVNVVESTDSSFTGGGGGASGITGEVIENIICPSPYMRYAKECCLDVNNNSICDRDEVSVVNNISQDNVTEEGVQKNNLGDKKVEDSILTIVKNSYNSLLILVRSLGKSSYFWYFVLFVVLLIAYNTLNIRHIFEQASRFASFIFLFRKKRNSNLVSNIPGIRVYSSSGRDIGKVEDVYLDYQHNKILGWLINVNSDIEKKVEKRLILVKPESVSSIGDVMVLGAALEDYLFDRSADEILEES